MCASPVVQAEGQERYEGMQRDTQKGRSWRMLKALRGAAVRDGSTECLVATPLAAPLPPLASSGVGGGRSKWAPRSKDYYHNASHTNRLMLWRSHLRVSHEDETLCAMMSE